MIYVYRILHIDRHENITNHITVLFISSPISLVKLFQTELELFIGPLPVLYAVRVATVASWQAVNLRTWVES